MIYAETSAEFGEIIAFWSKKLFSYVKVKIGERTLRRGRRVRSVITADREAMIAQALDSPEGRDTLAQAMIEPIRRSMDYQGIGRSLLMVDELPTGAYARYERELGQRVARENGMPEGSYAQHMEMVREQVARRTGIPTSRPQCSICGSRSGYCVHMNNRRTERDRRCSECGCSVEQGGRTLCNRCYHAYMNNISPRNRTSEERMQVELDRARLDVAMLQTEPRPLIIPDFTNSNNHSQGTALDEETRETRETRELLASVIGFPPEYVAAMVSEVSDTLEDADKVNNNASDTLDEDFNVELDRDTYSADR
jgi:hypothetical protein